MYRGQSIKFKRSKSKELIAYLIDRKGVSVSLNELYAVLWEKDYVDESTKSQLRNIISDIRQTLSCFKIDGLKSASKSTQKSLNFIQNCIKNQFKKLKRKTAVFFDFRLLDYLSSTLTVGYTIFDELCRYYFAVRFQKIFE